MIDDLKVVVFVLTTQKYQNRIDSIVQTWYKDVDTVFYSDHEDCENNIIKISNRIDYHGAEEKQVNILNNIKYFTNGDDQLLIDVYDWFFFVDDDTFVNAKNLKNNLKDLCTDNVYGQMFSYETDSDNNMYVHNFVPKDAKFPSGGAGFLVSSKTIRSIESFVNYKIGLGDVSVGLNFYHNNINQVHYNLMNSQTPEFLGHDDEKIKEQITYHFIRDAEGVKNYMKKLYKKTL